jgi:hypothetical protein
MSGRYEKLGRLVEERAVVLVAFDEEIAALSDPIAGTMNAEVPGDSSDQHRRVQPSVGQQPARQRRGGRLAMRAGNHDRARVPEEVLANGFRQ